MTENDLQLVETLARPGSFGDFGAKLVLDLCAEIRELQGEIQQLKSGMKKIAESCQDCNDPTELVPRDSREKTLLGVCLNGYLSVVRRER